jgi:hypothetical protein
LTFRRINAGEQSVASRNALFSKHINEVEDPLFSPYFQPTVANNQPHPDTFENSQVIATDMARRKTSACVPAALSPDSLLDGWHVSDLAECISGMNDFVSSWSLLKFAGEFRIRGTVEQGQDDVR